MKKTGSESKDRWQDHIREVGADINQTDLVKGSVVLLGFSCDEGVRRNNGRTGAKTGPEQVRNALTRLAWHHTGDILDAGDVTCIGEDLETAQDEFSRRINKLLQAGCFPIGIGGGHEIAFGHYSGIREFIQDASLGIINFDAHFDMRIPVDNLSNSGTSFYQIAQHCLEYQWPFHYLCIGIQKENNSAGLFQTAREHHANWIEASDVHMIRLKELKRQINQFLDSVGYVYLSFCLDVFHASVAPGVSAVNPLGLYPDIVMDLTKYIFQSSKVICMDIAELNPLYDIDSRTARLAASLIFNVMEWRKPGIR